jgi:hypothetical protein
MNLELSAGHLILLTLNHPGLVAPLRVSGTDKAIKHAGREFVPFSFDLNLDKRTIKVSVSDPIINQMVKKYNVFSIFMEIVDSKNPDVLINAYNFPEITME